MRKTVDSPRGCFPGRRRASLGLLLAEVRASPAVALVSPVGGGQTVAVGLISSTVTARPPAIS
jgi:hypothetical protein